jgi:hypothetical protein
VQGELAARYTRDRQTDNAVADLSTIDYTRASPITAGAIPRECRSDGARGWYMRKVRLVARPKTAWEVRARRERRELFGWIALVLAIAAMAAPIVVAGVLAIERGAGI